jgi:hypothetical protein
MVSLDLLDKILRLFGPSRVVALGPRPFTAGAIRPPAGAMDDPDHLVPVRLTLVTPEQFDRAYVEYGQFGPSSRVPVEERWPAVIPDVDRSKYVVLKAQCDEIRWTAARWYDDLCSGRIGGDREQVLKRMISVKYPFLTPEARRRTENYAIFVNR